jgi:putative endonuclease
LDVQSFYVYILASHSKVLYVGVTNDLERRVFQHRQGLHGFTARYRVTRLVYYDQTASVMAAIQREKQIKGWLRRKKVELIEETNPMWLDLAQDWFEG